MKMISKINQYFCKHMFVIHESIKLKDGILVKKPVCQCVRCRKIDPTKIALAYQITNYSVRPR